MNIFVTKLNYNTSDESLSQLFEEYGEVDTAKIIMDRETGRSKGFGFVEMPNDEEALDAIESINETEFDGRTIIVKKANPRDSSGGRGGNRGGYGGGDRRGGGGRGRY